MMTHSRLAIGLVLLAHLGVTRPLPAQPEEGDLILRVYDVSDLVRIAPDRPYRPGLPTIDNNIDMTAPPVTGGGSGGDFGGGGFGGGGGGGFFQVPDHPMPVVQEGASSDSASSASMRFTIHDLEDAITDTIAPESWIEVGGNAICTSLGSLLLIRQTPTVHEEVQALLQALGQQGGVQRTVTVEAFWLSTDNEARARVRSAAAEAQTDRDQLPALLASLKQAAKFHAEITCFTDQTVHVTSGERRAVVLSLIPVASAYAVGYQPRIAYPNIGMLLQVTPSLDPNGRTATLDLTSTVTAWNDPGEPLKLVTRVPQAQPGQSLAQAGAGTSEATIDRVNLTTQHLATTVRVPVGIPTLVGGMSAVDSSGGAGGDEARELALMVYVTIPEE